MHIQIFPRVQVGQEDRCLPAALGGQMGLIDPAVQVVPLDLPDLSALDPLLSLSGKNTTPVLAVHAKFQVGCIVVIAFSLTYLSFESIWTSGPLSIKVRMSNELKTTLEIMKKEQG